MALYCGFPCPVFAMGASHWQESGLFSFTTCMCGKDSEQQQWWGVGGTYHLCEQTGDSGGLVKAGYR